jgi:hypothetical protein
MRVDFHFYTIYALARAAGYNADNAYVIAYSSQYTDDEANPEPIDFENGGSFEPHITAHSLYSLETISPRICKEVWVPFHFVPGNKGENDDRMITKADGDIINEIIREFLENYNSLPYSSHLLGIILHAYADTLSHQNFMGIIDTKNDVREIWIDGESNDFVEKFVTEMGGEYLIPHLGHAQAASVPDEPNRKWGYTDYSGKALQIVNLGRALDAAKKCYEVLLRFLEKRPELKSYPPLTWEKISGKISELFETKGNLKDCITAWGEAIFTGTIGFKYEEKYRIYDAAEWFNMAIDTEETWSSEGPGQFLIHYQKRDNFDNSNLKLFNDAAGAYYSSLFIKTAEGLKLDQVMI